ISWNKQQIIIRLEDEQFAVHWQIKEKIVITLCQHD
ncbi:MAG: enterobactin synthase subunit EntD, partial [Escherichia coli]